MSEHFPQDPVEALATELGFVESEVMREERLHTIALLSSSGPDDYDNGLYWLGVENRHQWRYLGRDAALECSDDIRTTTYIGIRLVNASMMRDAGHEDTFLHELGYTEKYIRSLGRDEIADRINELRSQSKKPT